MTGTPPQFPPTVFLPPLAPSHDANNGVWFWPPFSMDQAQEEFEPSLLKKPRFSDECPPPNPPQNYFPIPTMPPPPPSLHLPPMNPPQNDRNSLFFKTRLCTKFKLGHCPYGNNCSFAHGPEELRVAPPNWQEIVAGEHCGDLNELQKIYKHKICKKFYKGEGCPYGDRCTFLHVSRNTLGEFREREATSLWNPGGAEQMTGGNGSKLNLSENGRSVSSFSGNGNGTDQKMAFWKTRLCHKWEMTGHCSYGDKCQYAHGSAELKKFGGHMESGRANVGAAHSKPLPDPAREASPPIRTQPTCKQQTQQGKGFLKWKGPKKISLIYGDWIDDLPLFTHTSPTKAER